MNSFDLSGRVALVTGSTSGIGEAMAGALERAGAQTIRHGLGGAPGALEVDLSVSGGAEALLAQAFSLPGAPDLLVCNAGSFFDVPFLEMDQARFEKTMRLNVEQAYFLAQGFARRLIAAQRPGAIVVISSTNGFQAEEDSTAYDLSKGALVMMTRTLALALAPYGIRVNGLAPGLIRTPFTSVWMDQKPAMVRHYENKIPLGRIGVPGDCGDVCVFLLSEAARYITGQTLIVDGGLTIGQIGRFEP